MATTHKPFRELVRPNSNFEFVGRTKIWAIVSTLLIIGSISMVFVNKQVRGDYLNWTIDFKGGTEMIWQFRDKTSKELKEVDTNAVRKALKEGGFGGFDVSDFRWEGSDGKEVPGMMTRTPMFGAMDKKKAEEVREAFNKKFADRNILTSRWSGDRLFVRSTEMIKWDEAKTFFDGFEKNWLKQWLPEDAKNFGEKAKGTKEYNVEFTVWGLDRQFKSALERGIANTSAEIINVYGVGAKAGKKLRNDGIKSLFYAMALIVLYLAFRFDIRYCPGAIVALLHDAILVIGVFAVTYTDVSLTSVAALLTVIGYSVNDTVVIFDRIRENVARLKDKKLPRVVNISLNETMQRTLLTSITLFVVTLAMNIFGTGLVRNFAFAMNVGVVVGIYSSVFVASPIFLWMDRTFYPSKLASGRGSSKRKVRRRSVDQPIEASADEVAAADAAIAAELGEGSDEADDGTDDDGTEAPKRRRPRKKRKKRRR